MKHKYLFRPLGQSSQRFKCSAGAFASFGTGALNMILQQKTNDDNISAQKEINKQNIQNQWNMFHAQNNRQDYLNANQDLIKRQSLQRAGLNLWSQFGGNPNVATNTVSQPEQKTVQKVAPQVGPEFAQILQNEPLVKAQAEKTKQEAEALRIQNNRDRTEDSQYGIEDMMNYVNEHPDADLPDVEVVPKNAGWFKAHREYNKYKGEQHQVNIYAIEAKIKNAQWVKPEVRTAIVNMPWQQLKHLVALTEQAIAETSVSNEQKELVKAQTAVAKLQEKLQQDNNIMPYIDKMFSGEFDFKDACKLLVLAVIGGMSRVSFSVSN